MGDYPTKYARHPSELTEQIFGPATQHEALKDEIYCQIMRQMTGNSYRCISSKHTVLHTFVKKCIQYRSPNTLVFS